MKTTQNLFFALVCSLVLAFATASSAQDIKQGVATVVRVQGEASYTLETGPNAKWIPLVAGKVLLAGASLKTEPGALVDVVLGKDIQMPQARPSPDRISFAPDSLERGMVDYKPSAEQNVVRLTGDTTLKIDKLTISDTGVDSVSDTELDLKHGRIFASVKKLSGASQYLIKVPNGIAGVRGTLLGLGSDDWCAVGKTSGKSSVWFSFTGPDGNLITLVIGEGNQCNASGQIIPNPPELMDLLHITGTALDTLYLQILSFSYDLTYTDVSATSGHNGIPK
jgi:hypothetical protein